ncbi:peptidyl-tRNA hydrolase PTH2-domain-containing protein [Panaeolus papilionaceus]|nr:peptidyl-tRNA hydrolase PTH2-domain-containing protein [Panaeolus papilionaceus]
MPCLHPQSGTQMALLVLAHAVLIGGVGYKLGQYFATPQPTIPISPTKKEEETSLVNGTNEQEEEISDSEDEDSLADGDLAAVKAGLLEPCSGGEDRSGCGHATLACYKALVKKNKSLVNHWERTGQAKIALKATSEDQILELEAIAKSLNLCARSIQDAGRTEVAAGSRTVLGIGPAPVSLVNEVTGKLRLL